MIAGVKKSQLEEAKTLGADSVVALDDDEAVERLGLWMRWRMRLGARPERCCWAR